MTQTDREDLAAPCGIDCFNCQVLEYNITDETRLRIAERRGIDPSRVSCRGCRVQGGYCILVDSCETLECVRSKGVSFCFECSEFPCLRLAPAQEGAAVFPHNMKVFNLCRMKAVGVGKWAEEEASRIRDLYYNGRFVPGSGPVDREPGN